jgi:haloalkane dehalogenase
VTFSLPQVSGTYPFQPHSFALGGNSLSYIDEGQGKVIVMLHGNPTWSYYYRNLVGLLKDKYRVIVPDHLGCGLSDKPQDYPYHLEDHIDNLEKLLVELKVDKISLVVHDWGGAIGMGYAVRHPEQIETLVILNTAAFLSSQIPWRIKICKTPLLGPLLVRGLNGFAGPARFMAVTKPMPDEIAKGYLAPYNSWHNRVAVCRFVQDIPLAPTDYSWKTLKHIEQGLAQFKNRPMLILWGGKDFCFNDHFYKTWREKFPEAQAKYFPEAGHYVLEDAFAEISPLVEKFFASEL